MHALTSLMRYEQEFFHSALAELQSNSSKEKILIWFLFSRFVSSKCHSKVKMSVLGKNRNVSKIVKDLSLTK